jgi:amidophosphoribosyltransferase
MNCHLGRFALVTVAKINNKEELAQQLLKENMHLSEFSSGKINPTELVALLIIKGKDYVDGIENVFNNIQGSCSMLLLTEDGIIAARDSWGRTPIVVGQKEEAVAVTSESSAFPNLGYEYLRDLGPGEMVEATPDGLATLLEPGEDTAICSFLWVYYGYPASTYEGRNVEMTRYRCGSALAKRTPTEADAACGIPDSGTSHALGYAHEAGIKFARPFVKYTPTWARSFMPQDQKQRERVASMKLIPIPGLIKDRRLVFCDDSIVRGTQLGKQAQKLYSLGCKETHMRIACPPLVYPCKFINFSRSKNEYDLITRRYIRDQEGENPDLDKYTDPDSEAYKGMVEYIRQKLNLTTLAFQRIDDLIHAIGLPADQLCTFCWSGKDYAETGDCYHCPCHSEDNESKDKE